MVSQHRAGTRKNNAVLDVQGRNRRGLAGVIGILEGAGRRGGSLLGLGLGHRLGLLHQSRAGAHNVPRTIAAQRRLGITFLPVVESVRS